MKLLLLTSVITCAMLSWHTVQSQSVIVRTPCNPNGFQCINSTSFVLCVDIGNNTFVPTPIVDNCPIDTICTDGIPVPCVQVTTVPPPTTAPSTPTPPPITISTTTTTTPVRPPFECTHHGKFRGPTCSEYYKCTKVVLWYIKTLHTCPFGLWFNAFTQLCVLPQISHCE